MIVLVLVFVAVVVLVSVTVAAIVPIVTNDDASVLLFLCIGKNWKQINLLFVFAVTVAAVNMISGSGSNMKTIQ